MINSFKKWFQAHEVTLGSDGVRDNAEVQTSKASQNVAQDALSDDRNSSIVSKISASTPKPIAVKKINQIATDAVRGSGQKGAQTTSPRVAAVIARDILGPVKSTNYFPAGVSLMKKS